MQVSNDYQPSFKAASFTPRALNAMSKRMPSGTFIQIQEKLDRMYKTSPLDIVIDTTMAESQRLCAKIKQNKLNLSKQILPQYFEESIISSIFCKPEKYFEKLCKEIDKQEIILLGKKAVAGVN